MSSETVLWDLRVIVEEIGGTPVCGLAVGDSFELTDSSRLRIPDGRHFCIYALQAVLPMLPALQRSSEPGDWLIDGLRVACPDPAERLVMRVERVRRRMHREPA